MMSGVMVVVFWMAYTMLVMSMVLWLARHPLSIGGCILLSYMVGSVVVGFVSSFVVGVFLFLTGVSGMMVAFLYVVALCPNPVFKSGGSGSYGVVYLRWLMTGFMIPVFVMFYSVAGSFSVEMMSLVESAQWMRDPCMFSGLAELMPFLGALLFLCMVSVVYMCGEQKQCLGGHKFGGSDSTKRVYA